jgi:anti-sigma factor RsiW
MPARAARDARQNPGPGEEHHPPVSRLLALFHRNLAPADSREVLVHLRLCPACADRMRRIDATISLFRGTSDWRRDCPSPMLLFRYASFELPDAESRPIHDHLPLCYTCRDELMVFRDVRQAARVGHSAFLNPLDWHLRATYWRRRGYWRWFLQPRWRRHGRWLMWGTVVLVSTLLVWKSVMLELERRPRVRAQRSLTELRSAAEKPPEERDRSSLDFQVPTGPRPIYAFHYRDGRRLIRLPSSHSDVRWATGQLEAAAQDPRTFRLGEPMGTDGLVVLRPPRPLGPQDLDWLEARLAAALNGPARSDARAWSAVRAELQRATRGEVWLMTRTLPIPTPAPTSGEE